MHLVKLVLLPLRLVEFGLGNHFLHHFFLALDVPIIIASTEVIPVIVLENSEGAQIARRRKQMRRRCDGHFYSVVLARDLLVELLVVGKLIVEVITALGTSSSAENKTALLLLC